MCDRPILHRKSLLYSRSENAWAIYFRILAFGLSLASEKTLFGPTGYPVELLPVTTVPLDVDKKRCPTFSLRIRMVNDKKTIAVGATVKLSITMRNISRSHIFFEAAPGLPQLIGFRPELRDTRGQPIPLTEYGKHYFEAPFSTTSDLIVPLAPGKTVIQELELDKLFDLSHPGKY